jgi:hypothetical protein
MFKRIMTKAREKRYLKEYKDIINRPFCFQYEYFKQLQERARADFLKDRISSQFYLNYFSVRDFREILATL